MTRHRRLFIQKVYSDRMAIQRLESTTTSTGLLRAQPAADRSGAACRNTYCSENMAKKGLESTTTRVEGCSGVGPPLNALVLREEHRCDGLRCDVRRSNHALPDVKATFLVHTLPLARDHPSSTRVKFATPAHVEKDRLEVLLVLCSAKLKLPVVHGSLKNVGHRQPRLALEITSAMAGIELSSCLQLRVGDVDLVAPKVFEVLVLADVTCRMRT